MRDESRGNKKSKNYESYRNESSPHGGNLAFGNKIAKTKPLR